MVDTESDELPSIDTLFKASSKKSSTLSKKAKKAPAKKTKKPANKKQKLNKENQNEDETSINNENEDSCHDDEKEVVNSDDDDNIEDETSTFDNKNADVDSCMSKISAYLREFDISLLKFVALDLNLNPGLVPDSARNDSSSNSHIARLSPHLLYFVLNDANKKLAVILKPKSTSKLLGFPSKPSKIQLFLQLNNTEPRETANFILTTCWDPLCDHLDSIYKHIRAIQIKSDNLKDPAELQNNPNNICLLKCVMHILKLMHMVFVWLNSVDESYSTSRIQTAIQKLGSKLEISNKGKATQTDVFTELLCYKYLSNLKDICLDIYTSDVLTQLMDLLCNKMRFVKHGQFGDEKKKRFSTFF